MGDRVGESGHGERVGYCGGRASGLAAELWALGRRAETWKGARRRSVTPVTDASR